jgi:uncharacterized membrane protein YbjE (DUF340 family)
MVPYERLRSSTCTCTRIDMTIDTFSSPCVFFSARFHSRLVISKPLRELSWWCSFIRRSSSSSCAVNLLKKLRRWRYFNAQELLATTHSVSHGSGQQLGHICDTGLFWGCSGGCIFVFWEFFSRHMSYIDIFFIGRIFLRGASCIAAQHLYLDFQQGKVHKSLPSCCETWTCLK